MQQVPSGVKFGSSVLRIEQFAKPIQLVFPPWLIENIKTDQWVNRYDVIAEMKLKIPRSRHSKFMYVFTKEHSFFLKAPASGLLLTNDIIHGTITILLPDDEPKPEPLSYLIDPLYQHSLYYSKYIQWTHSRNGQAAIDALAQTMETTAKIEGVDPKHLWLIDFLRKNNPSARSLVNHIRNAPED